jgi:L-ribulose-5-phosphate 4-epimerase
MKPFGALLGAIALLALPCKVVGQAAEMVIVDFEGKVMEGSLRPSSDTPTHRRLFQAFGAGIRSVVHTHSRNAVAFAQAGRHISCFGTTHGHYF